MALPAAGPSVTCNLASRTFLWVTRRKMAMMPAHGISEVTERRAGTRAPNDRAKLASPRASLDTTGAAWTMNRPRGDRWTGVTGEPTGLSRGAGVDDSDFDGAVDAYRRALGMFVTGDARQVLDLFSRREDVTLANPLGPPRRGWADVEKGVSEAAANFVGGSVRFEEVSRYSTSDLGYVVQLERCEVQFAGRDGIIPSSLRVTMVFRREGDNWRVAHRHADPITAARPISTVIDT